MGPGSLELIELPTSSHLASWRRSGPKVFFKKSVLENLAKFTVKHLYQSLFFNKIAGMRPPTLLKKRPWHRFFPVNFVKFLRTPPVAASVASHKYLQDCLDKTKNKILAHEVDYF